MARRLLHPLFALLASVSRQELARQVAFLKEENRILRERLPDRIVTTPNERRRLVRAGKKLGLQLKELISIVSYASFQRWVRQVEGRDGSRTAKPKRKTGRPRTSEEIRELVLRLRMESGFGYTHILGELKKLGLTVSRQTVKNILKEAGQTDPEPVPGIESWDEFLKRHAQTLWQCDFLTKKMWTLKGVIDLFVLVFLHVGTRRSWISTCTTNPTSDWMKQQARNFLIDAQDWRLPPEIVMRDNDGKFQGGFNRVLESAGVEVHLGAPMSPNLRAHVERFVQTYKHECLDHFVIVGQRHLDHISSEFQEWYNFERPHSSVGSLPPASARETANKEGEVVCHKRLGGVLRSYRRAG